MIARALAVALYLARSRAGIRARTAALAVLVVDRCGRLWLGDRRRLRSAPLLLLSLLLQLLSFPLQRRLQRPLLLGERGGPKGQRQGRGQAQGRGRGGQSRWSLRQWLHNAGLRLVRRRCGGKRQRFAACTPPDRPNPAKMRIWHAPC